MDLFVTGVIESFKLCADPLLMLLLFGGVIWGAIVGALPGVGATLGIGIVLPFTFGMNPVYAIALFMSINVANSFGNSIPAILMGVPGSSSAVLTAVDGYALHKQGKSGLALGVTYFASVFGQFISIFFFLAMVVPLSGLTYVFLAPEMFALYFLGMCAIISITGDNILKGLLAGAFGFAISLIGRDPVSAVTRFAFTPEMRDGFDVIPVTHGSPRDERAVPFDAPKLQMGRTRREVFGEVSFRQGLDASDAAHPDRDRHRVDPRRNPGTQRHSGRLHLLPAIETVVEASRRIRPREHRGRRRERSGAERLPGRRDGADVRIGHPRQQHDGDALRRLLMHGFVPGPQMIRQAPQLLYAAGGRNARLDLYAGADRLADVHLYC